MAKVKLLRSHQTATHNYPAGVVIDVDDETAGKLVDSGIATHETAAAASVVETATEAGAETRETATKASPKNAKRRQASGSGE